MDKSIRKDKRRTDKAHKQAHNKKAITKTTGPGVKSAPSVVSSALNPEDDEDEIHFQKRTIEKNWSKYDLPEVENESSEDEQLNAADFEKLLQMPVSVSGHFFFSTEKNWESDQTDITTSKPQFSKYFQIDTKILNACLKSIPFYSRQNYDETLFTKSEINSMNLAAELNEKKYRELCANEIVEKRKNMEKKGVVNEVIKEEEGERPPMYVDCTAMTRLPPNMPDPAPIFVDCTPMIKLPPNMPPNFRSSTSTEPEQDPPEINAMKIQEEVPVADKSKILEVKPTTVPKVTTVKSDKEDIQQWLDDILDD